MDEDEDGNSTVRLVAQLRRQPGRTMIFAGLALVDDCPMGWNGCAGCLERNAMVACGTNWCVLVSLCTDGPQPTRTSSRSARAMALASR